MKIQFFSDIVNEQARIFYNFEGDEQAVSFASISKILGEREEDDKRIDLYFNCKGGDCIEGWAIYDLLRQQSGCEIYSTIIGECSSMASIILLAAPLENRKAYANAHLCIHNPAVCHLDTENIGRITEQGARKAAAQILLQADQLHAEQQKILNVYVERTGSDANTLQALMDEDIFVDMEKAQELGFISGILSHTTASKKSQFNEIKNVNINKQMNKTNAKVTALEGVFAAIKKLVGMEDSATMQALAVTDVDGNVLNIEREEGVPQVGDVANPDGAFVMEDGSTIVVEGGMITAITPAVNPEPEEEPEDKKKQKCEADGEEMEPATEVTPENEELQQKIKEQEEQIKTLMEQVQTLTQQLEEMTEKQPDEEAKSIITMVADAGGKEMVEKALKARSTFNASNTKMVEMAKKEDSKFGSEYLEAQKQAHEVAMAKIRK